MGKGPGSPHPTQGNQEVNPLPLPTHPQPDKGADAEHIVGQLPGQHGSSKHLMGTSCGQSTSEGIILLLPGSTEQTHTDTQRHHIGMSL